MKKSTTGATGATCDGSNKLITKSSNDVKVGSKPLDYETSQSRNLRHLRELSAVHNQPFASKTWRHSDGLARYRKTKQQLDASKQHTSETFTKKVSFTAQEKRMLPPSNDQEWRRERRLSKTEERRPSIQIMVDDHTRTVRKVMDTKTDGVQYADNRHLRQKLETSSKTRRLGTPNTLDTGLALDRDTVNSLQDILRDAHLHSERRSSKDLTVDIHHNRAQKKRIHHLEEFLKNLELERTEDEFDPMKVLECRYLRLSQCNVEQLEQMVRESGRDPGIHCHTDLSKVSIFEEPSSSESM